MDTAVCKDRHNEIFKINMITLSYLVFFFSALYYKTKILYLFTVCVFRNSNYMYAMTIELLFFLNNGHTITKVSKQTRQTFFG